VLKVLKVPKVLKVETRELQGHKVLRIV